MKADKRHAEKFKASSSNEGSQDVCIKGHKTGHRSARSPSREAYTATKQVIFKENLGQGFQAFTRKLPLDNCVYQKYINRLKPAIISISRDIRENVFRAKLFVNNYITLRSQQLQSNDIPYCILTQRFWYSVI